MSLQRGMIFTLLVAALACGARAEDHRPGGSAGWSGARTSAPARQPLVINMGRPSSGYSRNFPTQQRTQSAPRSQPSWGHVNWSSPAGGPARASSAASWPGRSAGVPQSQAGHAPASSWRGTGFGSLRPAAGTRMAVAQHHHPYTLGYVRHKLRTLGVTAEPSLITDRSEMLHTDAQHSTISYPTRGPQGEALSGRRLDPSKATDAALVRAHMGRVDDPGWRANADSFNSIENRPGRYYWHQDHGFNYCHYLDDSGYQWYGWYLGDGFFWTRDFDGRWWWYDQAEGRWDFYNNNFWWWQDPDHVGDLYCYNQGSYIPVNSAEDQIIVSQPDNADFQVFTSPDGSREVRLVAGGADAFLYDTAVPPSFNPVYLASGVLSVQFSDTSNGRPLEIVLKLDDGSFDLFDAQGQAYGPGNSDSDASSYENGGDTIPTDQPVNP